MAKLTMFLVCTAFLVTVNAHPDFPDWMKDESNESFDIEKKSTKDKGLLDSMDDKSNDLSDMDKDFMKMTIPDITFNDKDFEEIKCKPGDKNCKHYSSVHSEHHESQIVNGKELVNKSDLKDIVDDNGKITKKEQHTK